MELLDTFGRANDIGQPYTVTFVNDYDLAVRNQGAVDEHVHRLARVLVQRDDRALNE